MKILYSIVVCLFLFSCSNQEKTKQLTEQEIDSSVQKREVLKDNYEKMDSIQDKNSQENLSFQEGTFIVDDYPITNQMLEENTNKIDNGTIRSHADWFANLNNNETIVLELYTDYHRLLICHFNNKSIPHQIIGRMELLTKRFDLASQEQRQKNFPELIPKAKVIPSKYFISNKGIKIGLEKEKVIEIYGTPHKQEIADKIEILKWEFIGDILYDGKTELNGKPLAKDNYGHQVTIFLKNGKVIGQILHNDIP